MPEPTGLSRPLVGVPVRGYGGARPPPSQVRGAPTAAVQRELGREGAAGPQGAGRRLWLVRYGRVRLRLGMGRMELAEEAPYPGKTQAFKSRALPYPPRTTC